MKERLAALGKEHLERGRESTALSKQGKYAEAADLLERFAAKYAAEVSGLATAAANQSSLKWQREGIAVLRQRAAWAERAKDDFASAQALLLDLLNQFRWDVDTATVEDPRVQALLAQARARDARTQALFSARRVRVVVHAPALSEPQRRRYAGAIAKSLASLGLRASELEGGESFVVTAALAEHVSAHWLGDDIDECTLAATATWAALEGIDLGDRGLGDETIEGDCVEKRLEESATHAARSVLRAWGRPHEPLPANSGEC